MTQKRFEQVKNLVEMKLNNKQVSEILKMSIGTICAIKKEPDFDSYKNTQKAYFARKALERANGTSLVTEKPSEKIETPIYDVLVEIKNQLTTTNTLLAQMGKPRFSRFKF